MARRNEYNRDRAPDQVDADGFLWRHWGDGGVGKTVGTRLQGYDPLGPGYVDVQVDTDGVLQTNSGGGGGGAATIADGADVAQGSTGDTAVITDTTGTVSGKLRGLVKWAYERMPASLGQKPMATSFPVTLASDQSTLPVSAASLPLPTGAATLAAQTQPGVDIGDVTVNNAAGASAVNIQDGGNSITVDGTVGVTNAALSVVGGGVEATAQRVTIATDSTGVLSVDDNGGSLTVDAASLPLPTGASTAALQTQPGVDIGDVTVNNAAGASAVNIQDGGNSITVDGPLTDAQLRASVVPVQLADNLGKTVTFVPVAQGAAGTTVLAAASPGNKHKIVGVMLTLSAAGTLKFTDTAGDLTGAMDISATGGMVVPSNPRCPIQQTVLVNQALSIVTTGGAAKGVVVIVTEP